MASNQPPPRWSTDLCNCGRTCGTCCMTMFLPCVTFGRIAERVDEGKSSCLMQGIVYGVLIFVHCSCLFSCIYREKLRTKYGLPAQPCGDFCVHWCCELCALCQEYEELLARGLEPSKGWVPPATSVAPMPMSMFR